MATQRSSWQLQRGEGHLVLTIALRSTCPECGNVQTSKCIAPVEVRRNEYGLNVSCRQCNIAYNVRLPAWQMRAAEHAIAGWEEQHNG